MLVKHIKRIVNALYVVFMQRFVATPHNALSVRKRPLSRNPESSYSQKPSKPMKIQLFCL